MIFPIAPTRQRVEGWPGGECVRASWATLLGLPVDSVPPLDPGSCRAAGEDQAARERRWLRGLGLRLVEVRAPEGESLPDAVLDAVPPGLHLISGVSPRGWGHRCVGWGGRVLWDPHPSGAGLSSVFSVGLVVSLTRSAKPTQR